MPGMPGPQGFDGKSMGLINGVKSGSLNRDEFIGLNNAANGIQQRKAQFLADGNLDRKEQKALAKMEKAYNKTYNKYTHGDYHPQTQGNNPYQQQQINQSARIYDGLRGGGITAGEGNHLLGQQRGIAGELGAFGANGINPFEARALQGHLNQASGSIWNARHNWAADWGAPKFPHFGAYGGF
jgi:hypothetical protein